MRNNVKCVYTECITNNLELKDRKLFCFPRSEELRQQWIINMMREDLLHLSHQKLFDRGFRVCCLHFADDQFQTSSKTKLNFGQIPHKIFPAGSSCSKFVSSVNSVPEIPVPPVTPAHTTHVTVFPVKPDSPITVPATSVPTTPVPPTTVPATPDSPATVSATPVPATPIPTIRAPRIPCQASPKRIKLRHLGVTRKHQLTRTEKKLHARLQRTERMLTLSRKRGRMLAQKCRNRKVDVLSPSSLTNIQNIYSLPRVLRIFVLSLLRNFSKTKKSRRYTLEEKSLFLSILKHGPRCYRFLEKLLSLPSVRTLRRSLAKFTLKSGLNDQLFNYLRNISENMPSQDRFCSLLFDEMELTQNLSLNINNGAWQAEGFVEIGAERSHKLADHVLVFMIRGIGKKWKQPVAFYFTQNAANRYILKHLIKQVISALHERTKFKVLCSVCDGGSWNVAAIRDLTVESGRQKDEFVYSISGNKIIHIFDAPHLLKCFRNNFITKNVVFNGKVAKWADIEKLYELDGASGAFKATKLTNAHVNPTNRQKMKVKLAAQTFSQSTAAFLQVLSTAGAMEAQGTAVFVKFMNDIFDSLNSVTMSTKPLACKLTENSIHLKFWESALRSLNRTKFLVNGKEVRNPQCLPLLIATIRNIIYLWNSLKDVGFEYVTLRSLNQDPLENLFSVTRGLCGSNTKPTSSQFVNAYKTAILNNLIKSGVGTNCEDDGEKLLFSYEIILSETPTISPNLTNPIPLASTSNPHVLHTPLFSDVTSLSDFNKSGYVAGYLLKKVLNYDCQFCKQFLCTDAITDSHNLTSLREYTDGEYRLKYASENFIKIIADCKEKIFSNIPEIILFPNLLSHLSYFSMPHNFCADHGFIIREKIISLLTLILLHHFVKLVNRKIRKKDFINNTVIDNFVSKIL